MANRKYLQRAKEQSGDNALLSLDTIKGEGTCRHVFPYVGNRGSGGKDAAQEQPGSQHRGVLEAVGQMEAVRVEVNGEAFLARTNLPPLAGKAFAALGIRPPPKVQPLN